MYVAESIPAIQSSHAENVSRGACYATCVYALLGGVSYGIKDPINGVGHDDSMIVLEDVEELLTYKPINVEKQGLGNAVDFTEEVLKKYLDEMGTHPELTKRILKVNNYQTIRMTNADKYHFQKHRTQFPPKF